MPRVLPYNDPSISPQLDFNSPELIALLGGQAAAARGDASALGFAAQQQQQRQFADQQAQEDQRQQNLLDQQRFEDQRQLGQDAFAADQYANAPAREAAAETQRLQTQNAIANANAETLRQQTIARNQQTLEGMKGTIPDEYIARAKPLVDGGADPFTATNIFAKQAKDQEAQDSLDKMRNEKTAADEANLELRRQLAVAAEEKAKAAQAAKLTTKSGFENAGIASLSPDEVAQYRTLEAERTAARANKDNQISRSPWYSPEAGSSKSGAKEQQYQALRVKALEAAANLLDGQQNQPTTQPSGGAPAPQPATPGVDGMPHTPGVQVVQGLVQAGHVPQALAPLMAKAIDDALAPASAGGRAITEAELDGITKDPVLQKMIRVAAEGHPMMAGAAGAGKPGGGGTGGTVGTVSTGDPVVDQVANYGRVDAATAVTALKAGQVAMSQGADVGMLGSYLAKQGVPNSGMVAFQVMKQLSGNRQWQDPADQAPAVPPQAGGTQRAAAAVPAAAVQKAVGLGLRDNGDGTFTHPGTGNRYRFNPQTNQFERA